jgi:phage terminase small subunit
VSRSRTPAKILELRGAFQAHPERRREDADGAGELNAAPPVHLPAAVVPAWQYIVARLPRVAVYESDAVAVEMAARLLAQCWLNPDVGALRELRQWLSALGMSPQARTKLPPARAGASESPFGELRATSGTADE